MRRGGPSVTYINTPPGLGHAQAVIPIMARLATEGAHSYPIRALATRIVHNVPSKNIRGELAALYKWVRDNIRYRFDPLGLEWIQSPIRTVKEAAGDCDDLTTLLSSLAQTLGHRVRYRTVGPSKTAQAHVQVQAFDGACWVDLDPVTEPMQLTTAARPNDLGTFAMRVNGADHLWSDGGKMLGFIPGPQLTKLWIFTPWERANMVARGEAMVPDLRYRSNATNGGPPRPYLIPEQQLRNAIQSKPDAMGRYPYFHNGQRGHLQRANQQNMGSFWDDVSSVVTSVVPGASLVKKAIQGKKVSLTDFVPGGALVSQAKGAVKIVGKIASGQKIKLDDIENATIPGGAAAVRLTGSAVKLIHSVPGLSEIAMMIPGVNIALPALDLALAGLKMAGGGKFDLGALVGALPYVSQIPGVGAVINAAKGAGLSQIGDVISFAQKKGGALAHGAGALASFVSKVSKVSGAVPSATNTAAVHALAAAHDQKNPPKRAPLKHIASLPHASAAKPVAHAAPRVIAKTPSGMPIHAPAPKALPAPAQPITINVNSSGASPADVQRLTQSLPKAKKAWDAVKKRWIYYTPAPTTMGAFKPSLSISLLGAQYTAAQKTQLAQAAVNDVRGFIARNGHPPAASRAAVLAFQQSDGQLSKDGEYGPNTRAAASYYMGVPVSSLPPVPTAWANYPITWRTPPTQAVTQPVTPKPAPAPVRRVTPAPAPKPRTTPTPAPAPVRRPPAPAPTPVHAASLPWFQSAKLVGLAQTAVTEIRAFMKRSNGKPPEVQLRSVGAYQQEHNNALKASGQTGVTVAKVDQLYGPATRTLIAETLNVHENQLPPVAADFMPHHAPTPHKPTPAPTPRPSPAPTPIHVQPTPAPGPSPAPKPKPHKPKPAPKPSGGGTQQPEIVALDDVNASGGGDKKDNTWLWLAGAYLYSRRHKRQPNRRRRAA